MDGDEDEPEVGEGGLVVAGGGLAVVLHAVEDVFDHVPPSPGDADGPGAPFLALRPRAGGPVESAAAWLRALVSNRGLFCLATENRTQDTGHVSIPGPQPICAKSRALGAADIFLEIITQPFLGFDGIVPGSSNQATV